LRRAPSAPLQAGYEGSAEGQRHSPTVAFDDPGTRTLDEPDQNALSGRAGLSAGPWASLTGRFPRNSGASPTRQGAAPRRERRSAPLVGAATRSRPLFCTHIAQKPPCNRRGVVPPGRPERAPTTARNACHAPAAHLRSRGQSMVLGRERPQPRSAPARSGPRRRQRDRSGVPRHAGAAVPAARSHARMLGDAEGRNAQPGPELQRTRHGDGGSHGSAHRSVESGVRERRKSRSGAGLQRPASRPGGHRRGRDSRQLAQAAPDRRVRRRHPA
jgi:hypothetical protein